MRSDSKFAVSKCHKQFDAFDHVLPSVVFSTVVYVSGTKYNLYVVVSDTNIVQTLYTQNETAFGYDSDNNLGATMSNPASGREINVESSPRA